MDKSDELLLKSPFRTYFSVINLSIFNLLFGYFMGITNSMTTPIFTLIYGYDPINDEATISGYQGVLNTLFAMGLFVGSFTSSTLANRFGRKNLTIANDFYGILAINSALITSIPAICISRFLVGVFLGIAMTNFPTLIYELYPQKVYQFGNSFAGVLIPVGLVLAFMFQNILSFEELAIHHRLIFVLPCIIPGIRILTTAINIRTDTPHFYFRHYSTDPESSTALIKKALNTVYKPSDTDRLALSMIDRLKEQLATKKPTVKQMFGRHFRQRMLVAVLINSMIDLTGYDPIVAYSNMLVKGIREDTAFLTLLCGISSFVGSLLGLFTIRHIGRKRLLVLGPLFQAFALFSIVGTSYIPSYFLVSTSIVLYFLSFGGGVGTSFNTYITEILPATGLSLSNAWSFITQILFSWTVPYIVLKIGRLTFVMFGIFCIILSIVLSKILVETKDTSHRRVLKRFINLKNIFICSCCRKNRDSCEKGAGVVITQNGLLMSSRSTGSGNVCSLDKTSASEESSKTKKLPKRLPKKRTEATIPTT